MIIRKTIITNMKVINKIKKRVTKLKELDHQEGDNQDQGKGEKAQGGGSLGRGDRS
jgi:hypothetical protein